MQQQHRKSGEKALKYWVHGKLRVVWSGILILSLINSLPNPERFNKRSVCLRFRLLVGHFGRYGLADYLVTGRWDRVPDVDDVVFGDISLKPRNWRWRAWMFSLAANSAQWRGPCTNAAAGFRFFNIYGQRQDPFFQAKRHIIFASRRSPATLPLSLATADSCGAGADRGSPRRRRRPWVDQVDRLTQGFTTAGAFTTVSAG